MFRRFLREYLSLTNSERRGFLILLILVNSAILLRLLIPVLVSPDNTNTTAQEISLPVSETHDSIRYFEFDPNTASLDSLIILGLSRATARTLINYREHGGRFRKKEDLLKIYGLDEKDFLLLEPYIKIESWQIINSKPEPEARFTSEPVVHNAIGRFELNGADSSVLVGVYGIGPVYAKRILKFRDLLGGFYSMQQLREVYGLSDEQYEELTRKSFTDSSRIQAINLNSAGWEELEKHPYLNSYQANALLAYRSRIGNFRSLEEITANNLLPEEVYSKISPYLEIPE
jgi:competence protein ComEA